MTLPMWSRAWLRPILRKRGVSDQTEAHSGERRAKTAPAAPMRAWAERTMGRAGHATMASALAATRANASAMTARLFRVASSSARRAFGRRARRFP